MGGRGKPRRAKSPNLNLKEFNPESPVSLSPTTFEEEEQNETTKRPKKRDQQQRKQPEEKPCAPKAVRGRTTKHSTEEANKQQDVPADSTKTKTYSARKNSKETTPGDAAHTQLKPETPKDIIKAPLKISKVKAPNGKAEDLNTEVQPVQKIKTEPSTAATTKSAAANTTRDKTFANKAACGRTEAQPDGSEEFLTGRAEDKEKVYRMILGKLKIKKVDRSKAAHVINDFIKQLIEYLKKSESFKEVEQLRTGSYYENLKISNPDEFDVMLPIPVARVQIDPFGTNGAFYSVQLKRGPEPLLKFQKNILSSYEMLKDFREEVKTFAKKQSEWKLTRKKPGCPAVTLTTEIESTTISLDVVLCLEVRSSWPQFTKDGFKIERWLGKKVRQDHKWKPFYLVPKYEGKGNVEKDGVLAKEAWRVSFSHIEKDIMKNHGSEKTCCEKGGASCCRKDCLKLLKHLLHLCKEKNSDLDKFCSYHVKTTLFHACCSRTKDNEWKASDLSRCFETLLQDFEGYLRNGELSNFFIPSQNLLSDIAKSECITLADCIKEQREMGFPVFKQDLGISP
ncbi:cyclic GMP-AMP synthase isoform X2 [Austrofundulus limnaeus]|uniref:Cyclic GMP-AMP synthase isoform X2 n=1 Tax=Austrofundulus limnaeus TaxID=52670 RepID=A0A2I4CYS9_AUSLI|nr:PREDICTED: cyclic GMP-AMP synthase isoform X2 [Austrofundulus limnaeus]